MSCLNSGERCLHFVCLFSQSRKIERSVLNSFIAGDSAKCCYVAKQEMNSERSYFDMVLKELDES